MFVLAIALNKQKFHLPNISQETSQHPSTGSLHWVVVSGKVAETSRLGKSPARWLCKLVEVILLLSAVISLCNRAHSSTCLTVWVCAHIRKAFITVPGSKSYVIVYWFCLVALAIIIYKTTLNRKIFLNSKLSLFLYL